MRPFPKLRMLGPNEFIFSNAKAGVIIPIHTDPRPPGNADSHVGNSGMGVPACPPPEGPMFGLSKVSLPGTGKMPVPPDADQEVSVPIADVDVGVPNHQWPIDELKRAAEAGEARAQYWLGRRLVKGQLCPLDHEAAFHWFSRSAKQGDAEAINAVGVCYLLGEGVPVDYRQAANYFRAASKRDDCWRAQCKAYWHMALIIERCLLNPQPNPKLAMDLLVIASSLGHPRAMILAGEYAEFGLHGYTVESKCAFGWYRSAARRGHAEGCYRLACMLTEQDPRLAVSWLKQAARKRHPEAMYQLALCLLREVAKKIWPEIALSPFRASPAMMARNGQPRAIALCRRAAEMGCLPAIRLMANCHCRGIGMSVSVESAIAWARLAAAKKEYAALISVAAEHYMGNCLSRNPHAALALLAEVPDEAIVNSSLALNLKCLCLADLGVSLHEAEVLAQCLLEDEPLNPLYLDSLGWALANQGRFVEGRYLIHNALTINRKNNPEILAHWAVLLAISGQTQLAEETLANSRQMASRVYPDEEIQGFIRRLAAVSDAKEDKQPPPPDPRG